MSLRYVPSRWWLFPQYQGAPLQPVHEGPITGVSDIGWTSWTDAPAGWTDPVEWAVPFLISVVTSQEAASAMTNKAAAEQILAAGKLAISQFLDDYCGTPPRLIPWPFPGPPPWISVIASQLAAAAHTFEGGSLRAALIELSGRVLDRVALNPQPLPPSPQP